MPVHHQESRVSNHGEQAGIPLHQRSREPEPSQHERDAYQHGKPAQTQISEPANCIHQAEEILNKKSGWKVLAGTTDFAQIAVENPPTKEHRLAFDIVVDRMLGYIGSYFVKLDGQVDAIVFAGGIGEKSAMIRRVLAEKSRCLGFAIDEAANSKGPEEQTVTDVSKGKDAPRVLICQTNEQVSLSPYVGHLYADLVSLKWRITVSVRGVDSIGGQVCAGQASVPCMQHPASC